MHNILLDRRNESFHEFARSTTSALNVPHIHTYRGEECSWTWDEPLRLLSISDEAGTVISLPLDSLHSCAVHLEKLDGRSFELLAFALDDAAHAIEMWGGEPPWPLPLAEAMGLLLMFLIAAKATRSQEPLIDAAKRVASRLPADGPSGAWYAVFQDHLPFAHRAGVLQAAADRHVVMPIPDLVWWTAKCRLDLATEWAATVRINDVDALREVVDAASGYVTLLQRETCRRAMERFYAAAGTCSENEVLRAHQVREEHTTRDELARTDVMNWLLRRYALRQTWEMLKATLRPSEWVGAILAAVLSLLGLAIFLTQSHSRWQALAQVAGFSSFVLLSPRIFALALPRGMFGTLLAWITVVVAQASDLLPMVGSDYDVHAISHNWLVNVMHPREELAAFFRNLRGPHPVDSLPAIFDFAGIVAVCLIVSTVFLMVEISNRLSTRVVKRAVHCVAVMLLGSLFWGAMLVPTLQSIVVGRVHSPACGCVFPAWLLGSVCAVAFGILVQLMWDDRAVAEPLGASEVATR